MTVPLAQGYNLSFCITNEKARLSRPAKASHKIYSIKTTLMRPLEGLTVRADGPYALDNKSSALGNLSYNLGNQDFALARPPVFVILDLSGW